MSGKRGPGEPVGLVTRVGSNPTPGAQNILFSRNNFLISKNVDEIIE